MVGKESRPEGNEFKDEGHTQRRTHTHNVCVGEVCWTLDSFALLLRSHAHARTHTHTHTHVSVSFPSLAPSTPRALIHANARLKN